jgi:uncharacterized CHY-type Zn-finger protein
MRPNFPSVRGVDLDPETRCAHYHGPTDIIAIKTKCCALSYACKDCHEDLADHPIEVWAQSEWNQQAILCGACGTELAIRQYMQCDSVVQVAGRSSIPDAEITIIFILQSDEERLNHEGWFDSRPRLDQHPHPSQNRWMWHPKSLRPSTQRW